MRKKYPDNLLSAVSLNEICGTAVDYAALTADQKNGLDNLLGQLTERERFVLDKHYREGISMRALADQCCVNQNHIRQIIRHAIKKCQVIELLLYVTDGFDARIKALSEQAAQAEGSYCQCYGIESESNLYWLEVDALDLSNKVLGTLERAGVRQVREVVILSQYEDGLRQIRMLGASAEAEIVARLQLAGLLPRQYEKIAGRPGRMKVDRELAAFRNLNRFANN